MNIINRFNRFQKILSNSNQFYKTTITTKISGIILGNSSKQIVTSNNNKYTFNKSFRSYSTIVEEDIEEEDIEEEDGDDDLDEEIDSKEKISKKKSDDTIVSLEKNLILERNIQEISQSLTEFYTPRAETINLESRLTGLKVKNLERVIKLNDQAESLIQIGEWSEAEPILQGAISFFKKNQMLLTPENSSSGISNKQVYGYLLANLALVYHNKEYQADAKLYYLEAIKHLKSESDQLFYGSTLLNYAELTSLLGSHELAIDYTIQAITSLEKIEKNITDERLNLAYLNLSSFYCQVQKYNEALPYCLKSFEGLEKSLGRENEIVRTVATNLSKIYQELGMNNEAEKLDREFEENPQGGLVFQSDPTDLSHINFSSLIKQWSEQGHQKSFDIDGFYKSSITSKKEYQSFFKQLQDNGVKFGSEISDLVQSELESLDYAPDKLSPWTPQTYTVNRNTHHIIEKSTTLAEPSDNNDYYIETPQELEKLGITKEKINEARQFIEQRDK